MVLSEYKYIKTKEILVSSGMKYSVKKSAKIPVTLDEDQPSLGPTLGTRSGTMCVHEYPCC
jgi:hypothetical protein